MTNKTAMNFGGYQREIYGAGLRGVLPNIPVDFATLERRAESAMPPSLLSYVQGGCGDEHTQRRNAAAFSDWGMTPRMMVDTSTRDLSIELLGMTLPTPLFMSPIGVTGICTQDRPAICRRWSEPGVLLRSHVARGGVGRCCLGSWAYARQL